jgi:hypothetical protein
MRNPTHMPELYEDSPAVGMHGIGDLAPAGNLLRGIQARGVLVTLGLGGHLRGLGDDQAGGGALSVVSRGQFARHKAGARTVARQGAHHDAVGEAQAAEGVRLEKCVSSHDPASSVRMPV